MRVAADPEISATLWRSYDRLTTRFLESARYTVFVAATGEDAVGVLDGHRGPVHLLLTDVVMPGMSGSQLAETLAQAGSTMKVLFMSGHTDDTVVRHGVLGAKAAFINKPFGKAALLQKIREVLEA